MLSIDTPLAAFSADIDRLALPSAALERGHAIGDALSAAVVIATELWNLAALPVDARPALASALARAAATPVGGQAEAGEDGATGESARTSEAPLAWLASWDDASALVQGVRARIEHMERIGAFHLAYVAITSAERALPHGGGRQLGLLYAQTGRIARQLGELELAESLYGHVRRLGHQLRDAELLARAALGFGALATMRGNYPAARRAYAAARRAAPTGTPLRADAHQGLMLAARAAGDLSAALTHGWSAFEAMGSDPERQAEILLNLSSLARSAGANDAALRGYLITLGRTTVGRLRLASLRGAALVAARIGQIALAERLSVEAEAEVGHSGQLYDAALSLLDLADAQLEIAQYVRAAALPETAGHAARDRARGLVARGRAIAATHGFHELGFRADALDVRLAHPESHTRIDQEDRGAVRTFAPAEATSAPQLTPAAWATISKLHALDVDGASLAVMA
jgi:tetratricopeptide (TPR) repeat protein